jgi:hypothetical protein
MMFGINMAWKPTTRSRVPLFSYPYTIRMKGPEIQVWGVTWAIVVRLPHHDKVAASQVNGGGFLDFWLIYSPSTGSAPPS